MPLRPLFRRLAKDSLNRIRKRLGAAKSVQGGSLTPKRRPDGRPLGGGLPNDVGRARIVVKNDGWTEYHRDEIFGYFHRGTGRQVRRPVIGFDKKQSFNYTEQVRKQLQKLIDRRTR